MGCIHSPVSVTDFPGRLASLSIWTAPIRKIWLVPERFGQYQRQQRFQGLYISYNDVRNSYMNLILFNGGVLINWLNGIGGYLQWSWYLAPRRSWKVRRRNGSFVTTHHRSLGEANVYVCLGGWWMRDVQIFFPTCQVRVPRLYQSYFPPSFLPCFLPSFPPSLLPSFLQILVGTAGPHWDLALAVEVRQCPCQRECRNRCQT